MATNSSEYNKNWRHKNAEKAKCHAIVNDYIKRKVLIKPTKCSCCGEEKELQAHHEDYSKPLEIIWLCAKCHSALHKQKRIENGFEYKQTRYIKKGYKNKGKSKPYKKDERYIRALELRRQGYTYQQIANNTGISKSQIYKWLNNPDYN